MTRDTRNLGGMAGFGGASQLLRKSRIEHPRRHLITITSHGNDFPTNYSVALL